MNLRVFAFAQSIVLLAALVAAAEVPTRRLSLADYRDHMHSGWIGQIAGVSLGGPTEFRWVGVTIPEDQMPKWQPKLINEAFNQDDLYVEMTFLRTLEQYGIDVSSRQAGIDFANSRYQLWCANKAGRDNLRKGIAPPDSGHPQFSKRPNDIDYQIEADYSGLIAPGLPNAAVALGEKFGRMMNYGDGLYGGQFIGALYAEAFFESDPEKIIQNALQYIPAGSQYAEMVRDMLAWHRAEPDWQKTWRLAVDKYVKNPAYQKMSNGDIDGKINGAFVLMGLLYGKGDLEQTMAIACRGGYDSDCNPSSAGGVLFTTVGYSKLPKCFTEELDRQEKFSYTTYNVPQLFEVTEKLARQVVVKFGGRIVTENGQEYFEIPVQEPKPSPLELSWEPGPIANSRFTEAEMAQIKVPSLEKEFAERFPGWTLKDCGNDMGPGLHAELGGKKNVFLTCPKDPGTPAVLSTKATLPAGKKTHLHVVVGHYRDGEFDLILLVNGKGEFRRPINQSTSDHGWITFDYDLSPLAGQEVKLDLGNQPTDGHFPAAYWAELGIISE